jgi:hypothetical protein
VQLDETSKALLKKLLDGATRLALLSKSNSFLILVVFFFSVLLFQSTEGKNEHNIETDSTTFKKNPFVFRASTRNL